MTSTERDRVAALIRECSIEISPRDPAAEQACRELLPPGMSVYVNHGPRDTYQEIVAAAARLRRAGFNPVPHLAARYLTGVTQLNDFLARASGEAGVVQVLAIAGDVSPPVGPFAASLQLMMSGLLPKHGISRVGIAGYPEPHPSIAAAALDEALRAKLELGRRTGLDISIVTQFCFEAEPILGWLRRIRAQGIDADVHVGLAGPASVSTLAKFAVRCGIGHSIRALARGHNSIARLLAEVGPERVMRSLAGAAEGADIVGLHFFTFGGIARTAAWLNALKKSSGRGAKLMEERHRWPKEGITRIPYWVYSDPEIYAREQERIFCGPSWSYVALEAEIPAAGDFLRTFIGDKSVIVLRDQDGAINVVENRCAHRGVQLCQKHLGRVNELMCPYHQWTYDLSGNLIGVPFRHGIRKQGGMPVDFDLREHGLRKLKVARRHGVVFASFAPEVEPLEDYLSPSVLELFDRVFDGRELRVLGYSRQLTPANWKLMFENIKDPYHASLLHVFLLSFGLFRADQPNRTVIDPKGRHAAGMTSRGEQKRTADNADMRSLIEDLRLKDPALLDPVREYPEYTVVLMTVWPNLIIQQQSNTLAMRQLVTKGPGAFELAWTFFGYANDDEAMTRRRLRQANLMGPAGFVSIDDSEVMMLAQRGIAAAPEAAGVAELGGYGWEQEDDHAVTESLIRAFYDYYRQVMDL